MHADQVVEMAASLLRPTSTSIPGPVPTVIPTPPEYQAASSHGYRALWVMFAIMLASSGVFAVSSWNVPISKRVFYVTTTLTAIIASLSYFALASGQAITYNCITVRDSHRHVPDTFREVCRQVYWARYVDWALTTPLLLVNLCLLAGIDGAHTLMAVAANIIMILSGLFSALGTTGTAQKWGWYTIACVSYVFVLWYVVLHGSRMSTAKGNTIKKLFTSMSVFVFLLWAAYPVVWAIADGARKMSVDTEIIIYAILDALAKPVFGLWFLITHRAMADTVVDLDGYWSHGLAANGRIRVGEED